MADIAQAVEQDQIADSLVSEPEESQVAEAPETEQQFETPPEEQAVETEGQEQEETAEDWLPGEQDKVFPDEVLNRYVQRYGLDENLLANPQLKQLLVDKINSDIYLKQQQEQAEQEPEQEPVEEPTPEQPQVSREQYFSNLTQAVQQRTDPQVAKAFHDEFLAAWQAPEAQRPMAVATTAGKYMLNLVNTFLPDMLQGQLSQQLEQVFPGIGPMFEKAAYASAWDGVRNSDQRYGDLPAYGTKEFKSVIASAAAKIPGFDELLPAQMKPAEAAKFYKMLAHFSVTGNADPALLQKAAAAGAKNARRAQVQRANGNLGSGQSKGASGPGSSKFQTNQDIFDDEALDIYTREHGKL